MKYASTPQIQKLHVLFSNLGIIDQKKDIILSLTEGRTDSSRKLFMDEARHLITNLSEYDPRERIKSLIFSLAYQAGIIYGATSEDKRMNAAKLNMFLKDRGAVKKELKEMSYQELIKVHRQFEGIVKNTAKSKEKKAADQAVKLLLESLDVKTV